jgi:hypothetical protein
MLAKGPSSGLLEQMLLYGMSMMMFLRGSGERIYP